jgi:hypothetical protein
VENAIVTGCSVRTALMHFSDLPRHHQPLPTRSRQVSPRVPYRAIKGRRACTGRASGAVTVGPCAIRPCVPPFRPRALSSFSAYGLRLLSGSR